MAAVNLTHGVAVEEEMMNGSETAPPEVRLISVETGARLLGIGTPSSPGQAASAELSAPHLRVSGTGL